MSDQEFLHGAIHGSLLAVISKPHRGYWALLAAAWIWAIWSCAEYWRGNPNYSYGCAVPCGNTMRPLRSRNSRDHRSEWAKTPPSWRAVYAAALRGDEREDAARDIIATIPMDKLSSEERALIEAK